MKKNNKNRILGNLKRSFKIGLLSKMSMIISFILIGLYLFQSAEMTRETYLLHSQDREISTILEKNRGREYDFIRFKSLSRVEELIAGRGFEEITKIHHVQIPGPQVATR